MCLTPAQRYQLRALDRARHSRIAIRCRHYLQNQNVSCVRKENVLSILAIELVARPTIVRLVEWLAVSVVLRRLARRITVGPYQIEGGPFSLKAATNEALRILSTVNQNDLARIACIWNGPAAKRRTRPDLWSYEEMLYISKALQQAQKSLQDCPSCGFTECYSARALVTNFYPPIGPRTVS